MKAYLAEKIITPRETLNNAYLHVADGKIISLSEEPECEEIITRFSDFTIAPGYIDIHTHGGLGYAAGFEDQDKLLEWSDYKVTKGVTSFLNTTTSMPLDKVEKGIEDTREVSRTKANILGVHLEGPLLTTSKKRGAQDLEHILTSFTRHHEKLLVDNQDIIKYMTVDPDHSDIKKIAAVCQEFDIKLSAGHTRISYDSFLDRKKLGFSSITHAFNGMVGLHHRNPGLAYSACMDDDIYAEIICDGHHVSYPMLKLFFKLKGYDRSILVTDSMKVTGLKSGRKYRIGEKNIFVHENGRLTTDEGGLAGSTLSMEEAVQNLVARLDIPTEKAIQMASLNPARLLGVERFKGSLTPRRDADFLVLDGSLKVRATFIRGQQHFCNV